MSGDPLIPSPPKIGLCFAATGPLLGFTAFSLVGFLSASSTTGVSREAWGAWTFGLLFAYGVSIVPAFFTGFFLALAYSANPSWTAMKAFGIGGGLSALFFAGLFWLVPDERDPWIVMNGVAIIAACGAFAATVCSFLFLRVPTSAETRKLHSE